MNSDLICIFIRKDDIGLPVTVLLSTFFYFGSQKTAPEKAVCKQSVDLVYYI